VQNSEEDQKSPKTSVIAPGFTTGLLASSVLVAAGALAESMAGQRHSLLRLNACKISLCLATVSAGTFALEEIFKPSTSEQRKNAANSYYLRTNV
jgi:hypothetical protein